MNTIDYVYHLGILEKKSKKKFDFEKELFPFNDFDILNAILQKNKQMFG